MPKSFDLDIEELSEKISEKIVNDKEFMKEIKKIISERLKDYLEVPSEED
jgi:translation elongation factor EF-1beta